MVEEKQSVASTAPLVTGSGPGTLTQDSLDGRSVGYELAAGVFKLRSGPVGFLRVFNWPKV